MILLIDAQVGSFDIGSGMMRVMLMRVGESRSLIWGEEDKFDFDFPLEMLEL